eukprot:TRINITY_DN1980_c0_g1_i3.p1 TRINITY_DN1980_c0_g1~~TRINITY_DN1980_c0_g1_i3.p1  ORF type:complete len:269 (+),score=53.24 TRINITY_DN1980_c0_g1_i3:354-1160(+)
MLLSSALFVLTVFVISVSSQCALNIDISLGNPWTNGGLGYRVVNLILSNTGSSPITSAQLQLSFGDSSYSIYQSWGLDSVSTNVYSLANSPVIVQGSPFTVGFIVQTSNPTANSQVIVFDQSSVSVIQANGVSCYIASTTTSGTTSTTGSVCSQPLFTLESTLANNWEGFDQFGNHLDYYQVSSKITNTGSTVLTNVQVLSPTAGDIISMWGVTPISGTCNPNPVCIYITPSYVSIQPGESYTFGSIFEFIVPEDDVQDLFYPHNTCN